MKLLLQLGVHRLEPGLFLLLPGNDVVNEPEAHHGPGAGFPGERTGYLQIVPLSGLRHDAEPVGEPCVIPEIGLQIPGQQRFHKIRGGPPVDESGKARFQLPPIIGKVGDGFARIQKAVGLGVGFQDRNGLFFKIQIEER